MEVFVSNQICNWWRVRNILHLFVVATWMLRVNVFLMYAYHIMSSTVSYITHSAVATLLSLYTIHTFRCTLKMDHHCRILLWQENHLLLLLYHVEHTLERRLPSLLPAWFFNCIGHHNHRHFILFVIFMWLGVIFVVQSFWRKIAFLYEGQSVSRLL